MVLFFGVFLLVLGTAFAPACTTAKKSEAADLKKSNLSKEEQQRLAEFQAEVEVGRNMAGRLLQAFGVYKNEGLAQYVNQVGGYVGSVSPNPERAYMFEILDSDSVNAFACPGGYILITAGAIRVAENEAELAAVLGHEVTHVGSRHMFNTLKKMSQEEMEKSSAEAAKAKLPEAILVRARPRADDSAFGNIMARYLAGASGAGINVVMAAAAGMGVILKKGLDKELEYAADQGGVKIAVQAGYDPKGMLAFLGRLQKKKKELRVDVLEETHPKLEERRLRIAKQLKDMNAQEIVGALGQERFEKWAGEIPPVKKDKG